MSNTIPTVYAIRQISTGLRRLLHKAEIVPLEIREGKE